ncbi:MAG: nitroreductase family protein [Bacteroidales bacterium]|nr:nitroreductase family protein [Bacteroidales bacterium]
MDFIELATSRFSVRDFSDRPVEEWKIEKILQAAKVAPTAVNYQPQKLYVVKSPDAMARLAAIRPLFGAPLAVIVCYDDSLSWKNSRDGGHDSGEVDASIVCTHMMLQAWELGIGSCWIGAFSPAAVSEAFGIPSNEHPVAILPLGYPSDGCKPSGMHLSYRDAGEWIKEI